MAPHLPRLPTHLLVRRYVGLKNQGATCYMNSLLQTLYNINLFRQVRVRAWGGCCSGHRHCVGVGTGAGGPAQPWLCAGGRMRC